MPYCITLASVPERLFLLFDTGVLEHEVIREHRPTPLPGNFQSGIAL